MNCPKCQTDNPSEAKFCMSCGSSLALACPNCGTELPSEAQFCFSCGHATTGEAPAAEPTAPQSAPDPKEARIEQYIPAELLAKMESARASGGMQGERRVVTMLFCDVQGSTAAAGKLDPEEWAEIMNGAFEHLISPVYRYEGTLARLMGDAILAFFGAPIAHEDDPQRAVLAALDIIESIQPYREQVKGQWDLDFDVRVGINTGLVVVGEVGSDLRVEYSALGDAVNLAARMEQTAEPGTVQITDDTHRLIAPLFDFEDLGGIEVKGKSEPVQTYRVLHAKAAPGRLRGIEGLDSPLVGREKEMSVLRAAIGELQQGRGQLVSVMGEAGLGKSRLVAELRHALFSQGLLLNGASGPDAATNGAAPSQISWYEGRSLSYETATPYAPFASLLGDSFGLSGNGADGDRYAAIRLRLATAVGDQTSNVAPFIASMLGEKVSGDDAERVKYLEPPQIREGVFRATAQLFETLAAAGPLVLVFEDLHWIDPTSLDLLEQLVAVTDRAALMIVCIFRPWRQEPSWRFHEIGSRDFSHRYSSVQLEPLDGERCRELVGHLLHVEDLPEKVRALILAKAEGNPFFVEEVIRSLLDAGLVVREDDHWKATSEIENIAVPDTLAGVITARLDQLPDESKRVAQTAAVIGREFQYNELSRVHDSGANLDETLTDLQRRELVRETSRVPRRVYMFKHAMTQETAYDSLLLSSRRELHLRVADCMEQIEPERVTDIARHFVEAREPARALPYLVAAGEQAAAAYSTPEAIGHFTQALGVLETDEDLQLARRAYEGLGGAQTFAYDVPAAVDTYQKMLNLAEVRGERPMQVSALNKLGYVTAFMQGQFQEGEQHLVDAESRAKDCGDLQGLAELHMTYCYLRTSAGDFNGAEDHLSEAAQIGHDLDLEEPKLFGLTHTANTMIYMTRYEEAWPAIQEARQLAEEAGNRKYLSEILALTTPLYYMREADFDTARKSAAEGMTLAAEIGAMDNEFSGAYVLGQMAWMSGEYEEAIGFQERALEAAQMSGTPYLQVAALCALGTIYLDISPEHADHTVEYHTRAMQLLEQPLGAVLGASAWSEIGFCKMALGELEAASALFQKGLTAPSATMHMLKPILLIGSAFVALVQNDFDEASKLVSGARGLAEASSIKHLYPFVAFADGQVAAARGEGERALEHFEKAEELAAALQMRPLVWQSRAGAAQVLSSLGRTSDADAKIEGARSMIAEIAGLFQDESFRGKFLESATDKLAVPTA